MPRLKDKVAVITGGAGGIGKATADLFVREGAKVLLVDLNPAALEKAAADRDPKKVATCTADVSRPEDAKRYINEAIKRFGRLDTIFSNAGTEGTVAPIVDYPLESFDRVIAVNVRGVWLGLQYGIPALARHGGGSIIITSSIAGLKGFAGLGAYVTSKHAVVGMMRSAVLEASPQGVRINTIHPSPIETRMMRSIETGAAPGAEGEAKKGFEAMIPMGRYGLSEEVAATALFLASDDSRFCTGGRYSVDGGMSVG